VQETLSEKRPGKETEKEKHFKMNAGDDGSERGKNRRTEGVGHKALDNGISQKFPIKRGGILKESGTRLKVGYVREKGSQLERTNLESSLFGNRSGSKNPGVIGNGVSDN